MGDGRPLRRPFHVPFHWVLLLCVVSAFSGYLAPRILLNRNVNLQTNTGLQAGVNHGEDGENFVEDIKMQVLSWEPRAVHFPGFASREQCQKIVEASAPRLAPSLLALRKGDTAEGTTNIRTSQGTFMTPSQDPSGTLAWVEEKIARVTLIPRTHGEPFNILKYQLGQKYDSHYDTFDEESYGKQPSQRVATFLLYLTDVEQEGETIFPLEGPGGLNRLKDIDYKSCSQGGLKVQPRAGDGLLFYSIHPNGTFDKYALHGGCPVAKGEKWVATKWIRDKSFGYRP